MARIFSIHFTYESIRYNAMVFVRETPFHKEYTLNMLDERLLHLLPSDKIISPEPGQFVFQNSELEEPSELMTQIIKAITEHMHSMHA